MFLAAGPARGASSTLPPARGRDMRSCSCDGFWRLCPSRDLRKDRTRLSWALVAPDGTLGRVQP
jgi:hypothetical protein